VVTFSGATDDIKWSRNSSVVQRWATGWMIGGLSPGKGLGIFLFTTVSIPAVGHIQFPTQWALSLGVKRPRREADHSPQSSAEVKTACSYSSTPLICLHGVVLR
jgi:hypothetical protein